MTSWIQICKIKVETTPQIWSLQLQKYIILKWIKCFKWLPHTPLGHYKIGAVNPKRYVSTQIKDNLMHNTHMKIHIISSVPIVEKKQSHANSFYFSLKLKSFRLPNFSKKNQNHVEFFHKRKQGVLNFSYNIHTVIPWYRCQYWTMAD